MMHEIETVDDLATAFGGTKRLAEWADVVPSCVSNWRDANHIPPGYHLRLYFECKARGLRVNTEKLFGLEPPTRKRSAGGAMGATA